jgi:hypothetical protein
MIVNPYNKNIIITKSFKQTQIMRQMLKLQYISLFSACTCKLAFGFKPQEEALMGLGRKKGLSLHISEQINPTPSDSRLIDIKYQAINPLRARTHSCIESTVLESRAKEGKRNSLQQRNRLSRKSLVFDKSTSVLPDVSEITVKERTHILHSLFIYNFDDLSK